MAKAAKIINPITTTIRDGKERVTTFKGKNEMMSASTPRRNLATNAILAGITAEQVMKITGHTTREQFMRYVRADSITNAVSVMRRNFFK